MSHRHYGDLSSSAGKELWVHGPWAFRQSQPSASCSQISIQYQTKVGLGVGDNMKFQPFACGSHCLSWLVSFVFVKHFTSIRSWRCKKTHRSLLWLCEGDASRAPRVVHSLLRHIQSCNWAPVATHKILIEHGADKLKDWVQRVLALHPTIAWARPPTMTREGLNRLLKLPSGGVSIRIGWQDSSVRRETGALFTFYSRLYHKLLCPFQYWWVSW